VINFPYFLLKKAENNLFQFSHKINSNKNCTNKYNFRFILFFSKMDSNSNSMKCVLGNKYIQNGENTQRPRATQQLERTYAYFLQKKRPKYLSSCRPHHYQTETVRLTLQKKVELSSPSSLENMATSWI
jgi:hypothetical protein